MHLHMHLKDCLLDYGPPYAFWCYPFERYNGILGQYHTNRRAIESQLMKKFCHSQAYVNGDVLSLEFGNYLPVENRRREDCNHAHCSYSLMHTVPLRLIDSFALDQNSAVKPLKPFKMKALSSEQSRQLLGIYEQLYPSKSVAHMSHLYHEYGRISLAGDTIGSEMPGPNSHSSATIAAYWPGCGNSLSSIDYTDRRVGKIQYFLQHKIEFHNENDTGSKKLQHLFCYVLWKKVHPNSNMFGQSAVVCIDLYELPSACCFLPVQRILGKCAHADIPVNLEGHEETLFVACPIPLKNMC